MEKIKKFITKLSQHSLALSSVIVFAGSMGANIAGWLYHLFVGRILGAEGYGELAALISLLYILNVPASVIQTVLVKFFSALKAKQEQGQARFLIRVATTKILIIEGVGMVVIFIFARAMALFLHISSPWYIVWLYFVFATFMVGIINGSAIQGFQLFTASSVLTTTGMMLRLFFGVGFAYFGVGWTLVSNIFSNALSFGLSFLPLRFFLRIKEKSLVINRTEILGFSVPAFVTTLGVTLLFSQDVLLVKHYFTSYEAGIYASLSVMGKVLFFATGAVSFVLFPVLSERKASGKNHSRLVYPALFIIGSICAALTALYFIAPQLVLLAFGKAFFGAAPYLGPFAVFMTFFSLASIMIQTLLALDKTNVWILTTVFSVMQLVLIVFLHDTLSHIIAVNIVVSVALFSSLLLYYAYGKTST